MAKTSDTTEFEFTKTAETQAKEAEESLGFIRDFSVTSNTEYRTALQLCADVKDRHAAIGAERKSLVKPVSADVKRTNETLGTALKLYAEAEGILKIKMVELNVVRATEIARLRDEAQEAAKAGDVEKAEALIEQADELEVPKLDGLAVSENWTGEVEDASKIPAKYLMPDVKALKELTKTKKRDPNIPGWKAFPESSATVTVSKVKR